MSQMYAMFNFIKFVLDALRNLSQQSEVIIRYECGVYKINITDVAGARINGNYIHNMKKGRL